MLRASSAKSALQLVRRGSDRSAAYDKRLLSLLRQMRASDREMVMTAVEALVAHRRSARSALRRAAAKAG